MFKHFHVTHSLSKSSNVWILPPAQICLLATWIPNSTLSDFGDPNNSCCKSFLFTIMFPISFKTAMQILSRHSTVMKSSILYNRRAFHARRFVLIRLSVIIIQYLIVIVNSNLFFHIILIFAFFPTRFTESRFRHHHAITTIFPSKTCVVSPSSYL